MSVNQTTAKTKTQKVFLRGTNLSREQARKIQKAINDRLAGKNVDVTAVFPVVTGEATSAQPTKIAATPAKSKVIKTKVKVEFSEGTKDYRDYYADGAFIGTVRESRSKPGTYRFKTFAAATIMTFPAYKQVSFKTFKAANDAFLKYLATYACFKTPTKQKLFN